METKHVFESGSEKPEMAQKGRFYINNADQNYPSFVSLDKAIEANRRFGGEILLSNGEPELTEDEKLEIKCRIEGDDTIPKLLSDIASAATDGDNDSFYLALDKLRPLVPKGTKAMELVEECEGLLEIVASLAPADELYFYASELQN